MIRRDFLQTNAQKVNVGATAADMAGAVVENRNPTGKTGGRICLGHYSYVWNNATDAVDGSGLVKYDSGEVINLVRVADSGGVLCRKGEGSGAYPYVIKKSDATELLHGLGENSLTVQSLSIMKVTDTDDAEELYRISLTIGTNRLAEIDTANQQCRPPSDKEENLQFCAINKFETIVRTNG